MFDIEKQFILPLAVAFLGSFIAVPFVIKLAWKLGLIDDPKKSKHPKVIHTEPTPRAGGVAIYFGLLLASLLFLPLDKHLLGILVGATMVIVVGVLDDKFNLNPYLRLVAQFLAAGAPIAAGIGIAFISSPFNGMIDLSRPRVTFDFLGETRSIWLLADAFALVWIVSIMNFMNMGAKGVDGQLSGVTAIAAATIAGLSLRFSADITEWPVIILAAITAGTFLGFLPWHIYPQKIMPAFSGSNLAGFLLAVLAILSTAKVGTLMVVLAVPLLDTGYTIVRRVLAGKSPVWGDAGHLHHKLLELGLGKPAVALLYWLVTATLGILAINLNAETKLYTMMGTAAILLGLLLWLTYRPRQS